MFSLGFPECTACLIQGFSEHTFLGGVVPGMEPAKDEEPVQGYIIRLATALGDWLLNLARPSEKLNVTHFRILCQRVKGGAFIHGPPPLISQRFTIDCLVSHASFWVFVYTEALTKKPLGGRKDVREA